MALAGAAVVLFAPSGEVIDALGWVWPPLFLALVVGTVVRVHRRLHSRTRSWVVYPLLSVYALCAVGGGYQTVREALDRRTYVAPGSSLTSAGTGFICTVPAPALPPSFSNQAWAKRARIGDGFRRRSQPTRGYAYTIARAVVGVIPLLPRKTA